MATTVCGEHLSNYNFPTHLRGDTFDGVLFTVTVNDVALDLTSTIIEMDLRLTPTGAIVESFDNDTEGGISIEDATAGKFKFDAQIIDLPAATYRYDIEFQFPNGTIKTYIGGNWKILQDVTYVSETG